YYSTNNGNTWKTFNTGLPGAHVTTFHIIGNDIYAGTYGNGVYKRSLSDLVGIAEAAEAIDFAVYPNPSSGTINISGAKGEVKIFNSFGQEVLTTNISSQQQT